MLDRQRAGEEVALADPATRVAYDRQLVRRLDAMGHHLHPEAAADADQNVDQRRSVSAGGYVPGRGWHRGGEEGLADLHHVDGDAAQVVQ